MLKPFVRFALVAVLTLIPAASFAENAEQQLLHTVVSLPHLSHTPLRRVLELITKQADLRFALDVDSLADVTKALDTPIDANFPSIPVGRALTLVLKSANLSYEIVGQTILIKNEENEYAAKEITYNVADLTAPIRKGESAVSNLDKIADLITSSIAAQTWQKNGGPGTLTVSDDGKSMTVDCAQVVQHEVAQLLEQLRGMRVAGAPKEALKQTVTLTFDNEPLTNVLAEISYQTNANILLGANCANPSVSINVKDLSAREALAKLLTPLAWRYKLADETVIISADKQFVTKTYPVADLVMSAKTGADFNSLIKEIRREVAPESWTRAETQARIDGFDTNLSLVVSQNEAGHEMLEAYLKKLRGN